MSEIVQVPFLINDDLALKLATGQYERFGGVIRVAMGENKGQIVEMLKEATTADRNIAHFEEGAISVKNSMFQVNKQNAVTGAIILGAIALTGVAIVGGIHIYKKKTGKYEPKQVKVLKADINKYVEALKEGNNSVELIDGLLNDVEKIKACKGFTEIESWLSLDQFGSFLNQIKEYTEEITNQETKSNSNSDILRFEDYLNLQRKVFAE